MKADESLFTVGYQQILKLRYFQAPRAYRLLYLLSHATFLTKGKHKKIAEYSFVATLYFCPKDECYGHHEFLCAYSCSI
jgi:hypothetical protein